MGSRGTDKHWREWGEKDPYFGVLSDPKFRRESIDSHRDDFFASGEGQIAKVLGRVEMLQAALNRGRALDFGCGVGRLTLPLARRFRETIGLDISPAILAEAQRNAALQGVETVTFAPSDDALSHATGSFDFVNSVIVLQHIPVSRGYGIIDQLLSRVRPGGAAYIHISLKRFQGGLQRAALWVRNQVPLARGPINLAMRRPFGDPPMQMNSYNFADVAAIHTRHGMTDALTDFDWHGSVLTVGILSRKPV